MSTKKWLHVISFLIIVSIASPLLSNEWSFYVNDHLGNARVVLDDGGNIKSYYDYYPFGLKQRSTITADDARFKFTGKELDDEFDLGWYYFGARYYDPQIGRWLSVDPLAHEFPSWNPYNYVFDNPIRHTDPDGRCPNCLNKFFEVLSAAFGGQPADERVMRNQPVVQTSSPSRGLPSKSMVKGLDATNQFTIAFAEEAVKSTAEGADATAMGATIVAAAGAVAAPFTGGSSLAISAVALEVSTAANAVSTAAKVVDAAAFDGSSEEAANQAMATVIDVATGGVAKTVGGSVMTKTAPHLAPKWRSSLTGQFIGNVAAGLTGGTIALSQAAASYFVQSQLQEDDEDK